MDNLTFAPGADAPSIRIAGRTYTLEYTLLAQYQLSKWGVSPVEVFKQLASPGPQTVHMAMTLLAAMAAHNFAKATPPEPVPSADWWAAMIPEEHWKSVCDAVGAAIPKPKPAAAQDPTPTANIQTV